MLCVSRLESAYVNYVHLWISNQSLITSVAIWHTELVTESICTGYVSSAHCLNLQPGYLKISGNYVRDSARA
jgi:hypothetical protein